MLFIIAILTLKIFLIFGNHFDEIVSLNFEDNVIDEKFSSFAKLNCRLLKQSQIDLTPSRSISNFQYRQETLFYTLKLHYKHREIQDYVITSLPMCRMVQAEFHYRLNLFLNEHGFIVSANILVQNSTCNMSTIERIKDFHYNVVVHLQPNQLGPQPDVQHFLEKLKREREEKLIAQENDNRPFVLKYWKYLLPIVVIFVLQSAFTDGGNGQ